MQQGYIMKKTIFIAGFFAIILLLMPLTAARVVNPITTKEDKPIRSIIKLIKEQIMSSIELIRENNKDKWVDPDGPTTGGLDDPTDYVNLATALLMLGQFGYSTIKLTDSDDLFKLFLRLSSMGIGGLLVIRSLSEAFDLKDCDRDGR